MNVICRLGYKSEGAWYFFCKFGKKKKMSTEEIKSKLHEGIENIDDNEFLLAIKELIERKYNSPDLPKLSAFQIQRIRESEKQFEEGEFYTNEQVDKIIDKWLEE